MSSVNVRPDACSLIYEKIQKMIYSDEKRNFLNIFLKYFKEWQSLNQKSAAMMQKSNCGNQLEDAILDQATTSKILISMN